MKINVFKEYDLDYPDDQIICLNDFNDSDLISLNIAIKSLFNGQKISLSEQAFISKSECEFIFDISQENLGTQQISEYIYICYLTKDYYKKMSDLIEYSIKNGINDNQYQWLYDVNTPIELLLSNKCIW